MDPMKTTGRTVTFDTMLSGQEHRWWVADEENVHQAVFQVFRSLRESDVGRLEANKHHGRLYGGPAGGDPANPSWSSLVDPNKDRLTLNVIKNSVDAVTAKIAKQRPAPRPLTSGGDASLQQKAKLLEKFLQAQFDISRVYQTMPKVFLDAAVFGTGAAKVFVDGKKICVERVFPSELFVEHHDGLYGDPRSIIQKKWVARDLLLQEYGDDEEKAKAIRMANQSDDADVLNDPYDLYFDPKSDQVLVVESWIRASNGKPGRHVIAIDKACLFDEEWEFEWLPFVFVTWSERLRGFWGQGLAEELNGIQREINILLRKIQSAFHLLAVPRVFIDAASKLNRAHFNNKIGALVPYVGKPPVVQSPQTIHPEVFAHLDRLVSLAYETAGISQLSARQQNPLGADASGVALQTWHDMETERFSIQAAKYEQAFLDLGKMMISLARTIGGKFSAPAKGDRYTVEWISWKDVDMEEDQYVLRVFPVSSLPSMPSGRLAAIIQMTNAGILTDVKRAQELLDFPDFDAYLSLDRASSELIDQMVDRMLNDGEFIAPEPFMDLQLAFKKVQAHYNRAFRMRVPEERLDLLRRFLTQTKRLMDAAQAEQMKVAMAAAGQQGPPTNPAAPPAPGPNGQPPGAVTPQDGVVSV